MKRQLALASSSIEQHAINKDHLFDCLGLERFLSTPVLRRTIAAKRDHMNAVLEEQSSQQRACIGNHFVCDEERRLNEEVLRQKAMASSCKAQERAERIAAAYYRLQE
mmetsp:Transcript_10690/g.19393  ORF Transcript_10690/g.19393 Transcript_10690/m.19393 type:complete len:108 (-) Transcript_10690:16-339(-)